MPFHLPESVAAIRQVAAFRHLHSSGRAPTPAIIDMMSSAAHVLGRTSLYYLSRLGLSRRSAIIKGQQEFERTPAPGLAASIQGESAESNALLRLRPLSKPSVAGDAVPSQSALRDAPGGSSSGFDDGIADITT